jgi:hypothetical protein
MVDPIVAKQRMAFCDCRSFDRHGFGTIRPNRSAACDVTGGSGCAVTGKFSKIMLCVAVFIYVIGAFFSYALVPLMVVMGMSS